MLIVTGAQEPLALDPHGKNEQPSENRGHLLAAIFDQLFHQGLKGIVLASLDALCRRFQIDNAERALHGALLDAKLLAEVYLELIGGRQPGLELAAAIEKRFGKKIAEQLTVGTEYQRNEDPDDDPFAVLWPQR